jgi:hypothetical protein
VKDLESEYRSETEDKLLLAGLDCLKEITAITDSYYVDNDSVKVQRSVITSIMTFHDRWERELPNYQGPTSTFHQYLLRFSKGAIKAWRIWLVDRKP